VLPFDLGDALSHDKRIRNSFEPAAAIVWLGMLVFGLMPQWVTRDAPFASAVSQIALTGVPD
jgi:hypothetical protein